MNTPRRVTPRRLGAAAVVYGVFVAGWYLGQPVTPDCHVDEVAVDRAAERYVPVQSPTPTPAPTRTPAPAPSAFPNDLDGDVRVMDHLTVSVTTTAHTVSCTNDTSERPRLRAWFDGRWQ